MNVPLSIQFSMFPQNVLLKFSVFSEADTNVRQHKLEYTGCDFANKTRSDFGGVQLVRRDTDTVEGVIVFRA